MTIRRPLALGAAATIGFGSLFFANAAFAEDGDAPATTETQAEQGAVATLDASKKYELAAAQTNTSAADIEQQEAAGDIIVSDHGFVAHIDGVIPSSGEDFEHSEAPVPGDPIGGSLPGAPVTIFLDFGGETLENTNWNLETGEETLTVAPGTGVDPAQVWASVAEDYAPFNVNVTITDPGQDALVKSSSDDNAYGSHVIVTDTPAEEILNGDSAGGVAWKDGAGSDFLRGAFVFTPTTGDNKNVAEAASHEAGHNFGLEHDGHEDEEYYVPSEGLWAPIMGAGYDVPVSQWSKGDYAGSTNAEDDLSIITDRSAARNFIVSVTYAESGEPYTGPICPYNGSDPENPQAGDQYQVPNSDNLCDGTGEVLDAEVSYTDRANFREDDHGNDAANATALDNADDSFNADGVIGTTGDVDAFSVRTAGGEVSASVEVADIAANLNAKLTLIDADGNVVEENEGDPQVVSRTEASGLGAEITANDVEAGTYTLLVEGVGVGNPVDEATGTNANGFTNYGSLGNYTLSGSAPAAPEAPAAPAITSPEDGETYESVTEIAGTGIPGATVTVAGAVTGEATVDEEGNWTLEANLTEEGEHTVTATQTVDGVVSEDEASVTFTIEAVDNSTAGTDGGNDASSDGGSDAGSNGGSDAGASGGSDAGSDAGSNVGSDGGNADSEAGTDDGDLANTGFESQSLLPYLLAAAGMVAVGGAAIYLARRKTAGNEI